MKGFIGQESIMLEPSSLTILAFESGMS